MVLVEPDFLRNSLKNNYLKNYEIKMRYSEKFRSLFFRYIFLMISLTLLLFSKCYFF